jgi:hypothetical protein
MIKNKKTAKSISGLMIDFQGRLNDSLITVKKNCSEDEFLQYRDKVSQILSFMLVKILNPLYVENPELKPSELYVPGISEKKKTKYDKKKFDQFLKDTNQSID